MNHSIEIGTKGLETIIVEKKDTALAVGSGSAEVYATPAMITLMEKAAFNSIQSLLQEGDTSVGIQINVQHSKASIPGAVISCESEVTRVEDKKIWFSIKVSDNKGEIGSAEHIRFVVNSAKFMERLQKK